MDATYQQRRVDNLWVGVVQKKDETWQTALVFYYGSSIQWVCSKISQLVHHSKCIHLRTHGASCLDAMHIKPNSSLYWKEKGEVNQGAYFIQLRIAANYYLVIN